MINRFLRHKLTLKWLIVLGLGAIGTVQYHIVQFATRFDTFFGDRGDARGFVYFMEHWYQALLGKANLASPGIFYPTKGTLAYSDLLVGFGIPYSLLRAVGFEMFTAVQVLIIALAFGTYLVCFVLLHKVLRLHVIAACAGAMFFAFSSPKFFQTGHLQLQFIICIPAIFIFLILLYQQSPSITTRRATLYLSLAAACFLLQMVTAFYYAWFLAVWIVLFAIPALILPSSRRRIFALMRKHFKALLFAAAFFLAGFVPFLLLYARTVRVGTWYSYQNVAEMIPSWWSLLSLGDGNYVWGWLAGLVRPEPWPATWGELMIGVGLVPSLAWLALTCLALWFVVLDFRFPANRAATNAEQESRTTRAMFAALVLASTAFLIIGLKFWGGRSLWYYVYLYFPGAGAIRAMSRYVIFLTLPLAIAVAYAAHLALSRAARQSRRQRIVVSAAVCLLLGFAVVEQFGRFKVGGTGFSKRAEKAYLQAMVAKLPPGCEAFYVTPGPGGKHNPFEYHYDAMLISALSGVPTINASSSQFPPQWHTMYDVKNPQYETHVQSWISLHSLRGPICRLEIGPQVEAFDLHAPGPLDDPAFFVRQQYLDFAGSEPTAADLAAYVTRLKDCKRNDNSCSRQNVSLEIFRNSGFSEDGSFIFRLYQIAFARPPRYEEFNIDLAELRAARAKFVEDFTNRTEFVNRYAAMSEPDYLANLAQHADGSLPDATRQSLSGKTRAHTLLAIAEDPEVTRKFANKAFVTLHYFGYLRRDPEKGGYDPWVHLLDKTGDNGRITAGFVNSMEYRLRFAL